jgi:sugar phosphate isomerase/epimerase
MFMNRKNDWRITRRDALAMMGAMATSAGLAYGAADEKKAGKPGIALQLYTMRDPAKKDLPGTLKKCREMGWEYVQWSGMPDMPAEEIRAALDTAGLKAISAHVSLESFEQDFDKALKFWKTVGVKYLGPGGMMKDCQDSLQAWLGGAKRFDAVGAKLREAGIRLSYHNHSSEFEKFDGDPRCKLDILMEATKPENLFAELDLAWVMHGGADPAAYIRKFKNRCLDVHAKDMDAGKTVKFQPLGKGCLNWKDIFAAGKESGVEWYVYEQDNCYGDIFGAAKTSLEFLKENLG